MMDELAPDALKATKTLLNAMGNGDGDAVLLSSDPNGPGLWTAGLKRAVFGAVAASMTLGATADAGTPGQSLLDLWSGPKSEAIFQLDQPSLDAFADQVGPKLFSKGGLNVELNAAPDGQNAGFVTGLDAGGVGENRCYAVYQPSLRDALGSEVRLENSMGSFALAHCVMAGGKSGSVDNIAGQGDLGRMMENLAAARLIEGNVLGEDGRDLTDSSSVRDAWFSSQLNQDPGVVTGPSVDGMASWLVLRRAEDALLAYQQPETVRELKDQAVGAVDDAIEDFGRMLPDISAKFPGDKIGMVDAAFRQVYEASSPETRLDRLDQFMRDPAGATEQIQQKGLEAYLGGGAAGLVLDSVKVMNPFSKPDLSLDQVQVKNPFEYAPEADLSFENGPRR